MPATLRIYTRNFEPLEEFTSVFWKARNNILNGVGQASFNLAISDSKVTPKTIRPGNMVRIHSSLHTPDWVGRIDTLTWEDDGTVSVQCNSREALLNGIAFEGKITSTDDIRELIHKFTNDPDVRLSGIHVGTIYSDTLDEADTINASGSFVDALNQLATALNADWMVHPSGRFDFVEHIGDDRSHDVVIEQTHDVVGSPRLSVITDGVVWYCKVIAQGEKADEIRFGEYRDEEIREFLGGDVRQQIVHEFAVLSESTLEQRAKQTVKKSLRAMFTLDLTINNERELIKQFWVGDTIRVNLQTIGWKLNAKARVMGVEVDESTTSIRLVLKPINARHWLRTFAGAH